MSDYHSENTQFITTYKAHEYDIDRRCTTYIFYLLLVQHSHAYGKILNICGLKPFRNEEGILDFKIEVARNSKKKTDTLTKNE